MMAQILWTAAGVLALVALNGLYVASEFALVGSRRSRLEALARDGNAAAGRVLRMVTDMRLLDRAIAGVQVGITCASLGLGMYGEHALAALLRPLLTDLGPVAGVASHGLASTLAVLLLTYLHVVVGEVVPKSIALLNPPRAAMALERPLRWTAVGLRPFVALLASVSGLILRLLRIRAAGEASHAMSLEELDSVIEESGAGGAIQADQAEVLASLVDFEDLPVRKVMLPRNQVAGLPAGATRSEVRAVLRATRHSRYPVYRGGLDDVIGFVHVKDLMGSLETGAPFRLEDLLRSLPYIPETASCARLLQVFRSRRTHIAVVLDEHGGTAGIVTLDDLVEEILGEVHDEFDAGEPDVRMLAAGVAMVQGVCRLDELEEDLELGLLDDDVDTVAGIVLKKLGRMAQPGDAVTVNRVRLTVEAVDHLAITRLRLEWDAEEGLPPDPTD